MAQIYYYRSFEEETMEEMLADNFFNPVYDRVKINDIILIYSSEENAYCWTKVKENKGGRVKVQYLEDNKVWETLRDHQRQITENDEKINKDLKDTTKAVLEYLGSRTNIFEVMPDVQFLDPLQYHKTTYENAEPESFVRIPKRTFGEENEKIKDVVDTYNDVLKVGSLVVDERGTLGVVEELTEGESNYTKVVITTISPQATLSKAIIGSFWFGKTKAETEVPAPTLENQSYYDFTTGKSYTSNAELAWVEDAEEKQLKIPEDIDCSLSR